MLRAIMIPSKERSEVVKTSELIKKLKAAGCYMIRPCIPMFSASLF